MNQPNEFNPGHDRVNSEQEDAAGNFYSGTESFFGVFTQCQVYLNGVRLIHDGKVTQQVSDLASQIENNRRRFLHSGDVNFTLQEMSRITGSYHQRVQAWESEANRREKNKKTMSGGALAKMKSELSMVRTQIRLAARMLTKLEVELHQIAGRESFDAKHAQPGNEWQDEDGHTSKAEFDDPGNKPGDETKPVLSVHEQSLAAHCVGQLNQFLSQLVGKSLLVSYEHADRTVNGDPDRTEQVWDNQADSKTPFFLVAGWTVKHPSNAEPMAIVRKKLDLDFWIVPKSLSASIAMRFVDEQTELWVSSRKLDSTRITFRLADESEFPKSELVSGFLERFATKYRDHSPTLLIANIHHLEWTQKNVVATHSEKRDP